MASAPSLALRSLLTGVLRETGLQSPLQRISGATSPVRALAIAAAAKRAGGTVLLVVPTDADIESTVGDISFFLSVLEGSATAAVERQVLPFPSTQVDPYRGFQPHLKVASARARVLHSLANGSARVIVASAASLLTKVPDPATILLSSCDITPGVDIDPVVLANTLVLGGYEPADPVDAHGEFGRRGGILDVFPAGEELPIRIEFIGDTVESIRRFDPGTQRSVETLDRFGIVPVREGQSEIKSSIFEFLRTRDSQVWVSEPTDVEANVAAGWEQIGTSYADALERTKTPTLIAPPTELVLAPDEVIGSARDSGCRRGARDRGSGIRDQGSGAVSSFSSTRRVVSWTHSRLDRRRQSRASQWRFRRLRRRLAWARRAHRRTAEGLRPPRDHGVGRRRCRPRRGDGRRRVGSQRDSVYEALKVLQDLKTSRPQDLAPFRSTPKPMSSTKSGARPAPARSDRRRPPSCPTCATSRSAI